MNSAVDGMLACRHLYSWSDWHGGEALGVKVLEVGNVPALVLTGLFGFVGHLSIARIFSACTWSWLPAGIFLAAASVQWWLVGAAVENGWRRLRQ